MRLFEVVCALLTVWMSLTVAMFYHDEIYEMQEIGCAGRVRVEQLSTHLNQVKCAPRDTVVKLRSKIPGTILFPDYAIAKRCGGFCMRKSCLPLEKVNITIPVRVFFFNSYKCHHVYVEQHTKCRCQCSAEDCNENQRYSEENCMCECKSRQECNRARRMIWDEDTCRCTCRENHQVCSSGLEWVPSRCGCAKIMYDGNALD